MEVPVHTDSDESAAAPSSEVSQTASVAPAAPAPQAQPASVPQTLVSARNNKLLMVAGGSVLVLLVVIALIVALVAKQSTPTPVVSSDKTLNTSEFQALFLTNGQVYFGKLSNLDAKYITLTDIFYLQVQQGTTQSVQPASKDASSSQVSLAKLGSELHGPEDKMSVASDQVLFWENLKPDSKVVQAITKYQPK